MLLGLHCSHRERRHNPLLSFICGKACVVYGKEQVTKDLVGYRCGFSWPAPKRCINSHAEHLQVGGTPWCASYSPLCLASTHVTTGVVLRLA